MAFGAFAEEVSARDRCQRFEMPLLALRADLHAARLVQDIPRAAGLRAVGALFADDDRGRH